MVDMVQQSKLMEHYGHGDNNHNGQLGQNNINTIFITSSSIPGTTWVV